MSKSQTTDLVKTSNESLPTGVITIGSEVSEADIQEIVKSITNPDIAVGEVICERNISLDNLNSLVDAIKQNPAIKKVGFDLSGLEEETEGLKVLAGLDKNVEIVVKSHVVNAMNNFSIWDFLVADKKLLDKKTSEMPETPGEQKFNSEQLKSFLYTPVRQILREAQAHLSPPASVGTKGASAVTASAKSQVIEK